MQPLTALANLLYPPVCALCRTTLRASDGAPDGYGFLLCAPCRAVMPRCHPPVCTVCGVSLPGAFDAVEVCRACRRRASPFEAARAPWRYEGPGREAVHQFKYSRRHRLGGWLSDTMASAARAALPVRAIDLVVPVPAYWLTRRLRGFDAPAHLARRVARLLETPYAPAALRRTRWTASQTRLSLGRRLRNVRAAFAAKPSLVRGRTVLLVDDVLTTGATAGACAEALRRAGAARVLVLTAARTPGA